MIDLFNSGAGPFVVPLAVCGAALIAGDLMRPGGGRIASLFRRFRTPRIPADLFSAAADEVICFDTLPGKDRRLAPFIAPIRREPIYFALDKLYGSMDPERLEVFVNVYESVAPFQGKTPPYVSNLAHPNRRQAIDTARGEDRRCLYRLRVKLKPPSQWPKIPVLPEGDKLEMRAFQPRNFNGTGYHADGRRKTFDEWAQENSPITVAELEFGLEDDQIVPSTFPFSELPIRGDRKAPGGPYLKHSRLKDPGPISKP